MRRNSSQSPLGSEGRWWLIHTPERDQTSYASALTKQLLARHGVLTREAVLSENVVGGFTSIYGVLRILEERGEVRRGYFVDGLGPSQFCIVGAEERLRREHEGEVEWTILSAVDPANVYGAALPWPKVKGMRFERAANAYVILHEGALIGFLSRGEQALNVLLSDDLALAKICL